MSISKEPVPWSKAFSMWNSKYLLHVRNVYYFSYGSPHIEKALYATNSEGFSPGEVSGTGTNHLAQKHTGVI